MHFPKLSLILAAACLTGCGNLVSLNEFAPEGTTASEPGLAGVWADGNGSESYIVRLDGDTYRITRLEKESAPLRLEARAYRVDGATLLDLFPRDAAPLQQPVHSIVRFWLEGDSLRVAFLETDWLRQHAAAELASQVIDGRTVITAHGAELRGFLARYGARTEAYKDVSTLQRVR